jgi:hypothetical protein
MSNGKVCHYCAHFMLNEKEIKYGVEGGRWNEYNGITPTFPMKLGNVCVAIATTDNCSDRNFAWWQNAFLVWKCRDGHVYGRQLINAREIEATICVASLTATKKYIRAELRLSRWLASWRGSKTFLIKIPRHELKGSSISFETIKCQP